MANNSALLGPIADKGSLRRKFACVHKAQGPAIADEAIRRIAGLYAVEKAAWGLTPEKRAEIRQAEAKPIFQGFEVWLNSQPPHISGKSPLASAIRYAPTRMARMRPYLDHGILEITIIPPSGRSPCAARTTALWALKPAANQQSSPTP